MDATQLGYFMAVLREGSYAQAAKKLFISPQGLSKAIHTLEGELGVNLFETTGTGLALTEYGRALQAHCQPYLREHQRIFNEMESLRRKSDQWLGIGIKSGFSDGLGRNFLLDFILDHPELQVSLRSFPIPGLREAMKAPERSVWMIPGQYDPTLFESIYERREKLFLIVGESHPLADRGAISVKELAGHPLVALPHDIGQQQIVDRVLEEHLLETPKYLLDIADRDFTMRLVQSGKAASFNSGWAYQNYPGIRRVEFTDLDVVVRANVLVRRDAVDSTALRAFRAYVAEFARTQGEGPGKR